MRRGNKKKFATNKELEAQLVAFKNSNVSNESLSMVFGVHKTSIATRLKKLGLDYKTDFSLRKVMSKVIQKSIVEQGLEEKFSKKSKYKIIDGRRVELGKMHKDYLK